MCTDPCGGSWISTLRLGSHDARYSISVAVASTGVDSSSSRWVPLFFWEVYLLFIIVTLLFVCLFFPVTVSCCSPAMGHRSPLPPSFSQAVGARLVRARRLAPKLLPAQF